MDFTIKPLTTNEQPLMGDFLYLSIHQEPGAVPVPKSIIEKPEFQIYINNFGKTSDLGFIAESNTLVIGMVWVRNIDGYGSIDDDTPELAISVLPEYRGQGIGRALLERILDELKTARHARCSLSVQKSNRAAKLYFSLGFEVYRETESEYILVHRLGVHSD